MEYKNVVAPDLGSLDILVNKAREEGWNLWEGLARFQVADPRKVAHSVDYVQTMVKDAAKVDRIAQLEATLGKLIQEVDIQSAAWEAMEGNLKELVGASDELMKQAGELEITLSQQIKELVEIHTEEWKHKK